MKVCNQCGVTDPAAFTSAQKYKCRVCVKEYNQMRLTTDSGQLRQVWHGMRQRCEDTRHNCYHRYGGRGIRIEFRDFEHFLSWALSNGYETGLEIDRTDNDGNYSPENCRFVTRKTNMQNTSRAKRLEAFGETKPLTTWAEDPRCVVSRGTLYQRIHRYGWEPERAISTYAHEGYIN